MNRIRWSLAALLIPLLTPALAMAGGSQTGILEGQVTGADGTPAASAAVSLISDALMKGYADATTDDNGGFRFLELPPGVYDILIEHPELGSATEFEVRVSLPRTSIGKIAKGELRAEAVRPATPPGAP